MNLGITIVRQYDYSRSEANLTQFMKSTLGSASIIHLEYFTFTCFEALIRVAAYSSWVLRSVNNMR